MLPGGRGRGGTEHSCHAAGWGGWGVRATCRAEQAPGPGGLGPLTLKSPSHVSTTAALMSHSCRNTTPGFGERNKHDETSTRQKTMPSTTIGGGGGHAPKRHRCCTGRHPACVDGQNDSLLPKNTDTPRVGARALLPRGGGQPFGKAGHLCCLLWAQFLLPWCSHHLSIPSRGHLVLTASRVHISSRVAGCARRSCPGVTSSSWCHPCLRLPGSQGMHTSPRRTTSGKWCSLSILGEEFP